MICLDTNYLVCTLIPGSLEAKAVGTWLRMGERLFAPSVAWYEFLCGPVTAEEVRLVRRFLAGGVIAFEEAQAATAARLFNAVGRTRRFRVDAMIAACAIEAGCRLATSNRADFTVFVPHGLVLCDYR
jgi:predicted nucleic acid-binding protein